MRHLIACLVLLSMIGLPSAQAAEANVILDTSGSMWRYFETWQTDIVKADSGELVQVDPLNPRTGAKDATKLAVTKNVLSSDLPPAGWQKTDFDDSRWLHRNQSMRTQYRSLALQCIRGKFEVKAPSDLNLSLIYQGGVVVYVNGVEAGRCSMPKGEIKNDTLAEEYTKECYAADGALLLQTQLSGKVFDEPQLLKSNGAGKDRFRKSSITIPAKMLNKGVNVLAIEAHRAPANALMFTSTKTKGSPVHDFGMRMQFWWNRCSIDEVKLTGNGAVANIQRPKGPQVWTQPALLDYNYTQYGDPNEPIYPIRLRGAANGCYCGEAVLSSTEAIKGIQAVVSDLKGPGGVIPAASIQIKYCLKLWNGWVPDAIGRWVRYDPLDSTPPAGVPLLAEGGQNFAGVPIWVIVKVPPDAKPGNYAGKLTVQAEGLKPTDVPIQLYVADWILPDPKDFITHVALIQSPESVALQYNVKMWSDEHWKLIDKSFQLMGELGNKEINIPLIAKTHFGVEQGMVRWVKQTDGSYKYDFSIAEKYLDTAIKRFGKIPVVCLQILETGPEHGKQFLYTALDPKTGTCTEGKAPPWGTPECVAFMKPVFAGMREILAKRGLEKSMMVGFHTHGGSSGVMNDNPKAWKDVQTAAGPDVKWVRISHYWFGDQDRAANSPKWGRAALVGGVISVFWDVDADKPIYGWKNPDIMITYPRTGNNDYAGTRLGQDAFMPESRLCAEAVLLSGRRKPVNLTRGNIAGEDGYDRYMGLRGFGPFGADFWPVIKNGQETKTILGRFGDGYQYGGWGTLSFNAVVQYVLWPCKDGAGTTARYEMMREALQEAEARIFVQNALLDNKISGDLARQAKLLCDNRTRSLRYVSEFWTCGLVQNQTAIPDMIMPSYWEDESKKLYDMAAAVAKIVGKRTVAPAAPLKAEPGR